MDKNQLIQIGVAQNQYPQYLYKYRSAQSPFTNRIFTDNELLFSNPLIFNDPFDCNTPITTNPTIDEIKNWLVSVGIFAKHIDELADQIKANPNLMRDETSKALSEFGICCFSSLDKSILQWSHYADYHKGICLEFDITKDLDFFMTPIIVAYKHLMQHYNHFSGSNQIIEYLIKPKFADWSYESEIRIVKSLDDIKNNKNNRAFKFKDSALKEVIFGTNTPPNIITQYRQLCANNGKGHVTFSKMELGRGVHYELIKKTI